MFRVMLNILGGKSLFILPNLSRTHRKLLPITNFKQWFSK